MYQEPGGHRLHDHHAEFVPMDQDERAWAQFAAQNPQHAVPAVGGPVEQGHLADHVGPVIPDASTPPLALPSASALVLSTGEKMAHLMPQGKPLLLISDVSFEQMQEIAAQSQRSVAAAKSVAGIMPGISRACVGAAFALLALLLVSTVYKWWRRSNKKK